MKQIVKDLDAVIALIGDAPVSPQTVKALRILREIRSALAKIS